MEERIKKWYQRTELTQQELSEKIGVSKGAVSHILSGRNKPSLEFVQNLKRVFPEISLDWLILGNGEMLLTEKKSQAINIEKELERIQYTAEQTHREILYQLAEIKEKLNK